MSKKTLIVFLAPSGFGKSTAAKYLKETYSGEIIKLATPLYDIQSDLYKRLNLPETGQDGELLQFLGHKIQTLKPDFLFNEFLKKTNQSSRRLIINDDCRPHNFDYLKSIGAVFIKINGFSREREEDHTSLNSNHPVEWQEPIPYDFEVNNLSSLEDFYKELDETMRIVCG